MPLMDFFRQKARRSIPSKVLNKAPLLNIAEGEALVIMYTSASDKMKIFSAYVREGLDNGDLVDYAYPDEESDVVRDRLRKDGIDVEEYEGEGSLALKGLAEYFLPDGKFKAERAVREGLHRWAEAKKRGYKHFRDIEDYGDFSFVNGQWQKFVKDYWLDPRWNDPDVSEWVESKDPVGVVYDSFIIDLTAFNVEDMRNTQVDEILTTFGGGTLPPRRFFIDLLQDVDSFSAYVGLDHQRLLGRKILLEFDPVSNYERVVASLARESRANVEPIFVFTSTISPIHTHLAEYPALKFFLTSISTSSPRSTSENKVLLPAKNTPLILDALSKVLETCGRANVCFVFDILSDLLISVGQEKTFTFLRHALDMLASKKVTGLFLLNASAHEPRVTSQIRGMFHNLLTYEEDATKVVKIS